MILSPFWTTQSPPAPCRRALLIRLRKIRPRLSGEADTRRDSSENRISGSTPFSSNTWYRPTIQSHSTGNAGVGLHSMTNSSFVSFVYKNNSSSISFNSSSLLRTMEMYRLCVSLSPQSSSICRYPAALVSGVRISCAMLEIVFFNCFWDLSYWKRLVRKD